MAIAPHDHAVHRLQLAVIARRPAIISAFYEWLYRAITAQETREVATLIRLFVSLPELQETLSSILRPVGVSIKGVFCHLSGKTGPVVDFDPPGAGCEISDLLILVTYGAGGTTSLGNAVFLQAKKERNDLRKGKGSSTGRQRELYERAALFTFRGALDYQTSLHEPAIAGRREMPPKNTSAFCYWPFYSRKAVTGYSLNSSSIIIPRLLDDPTRDIASAEALYQLLVGELGLQANAPRPGEFGWNRIVHDVTLRAMREALRCKTGIVNVEDLPRVGPWDQVEILAAYTPTLALALNPFEELGRAFESDHFQKVSSELASRPRIDKRDLATAFGDGGGKPPTPRQIDEPQPDDNGGAAFIQIHIGEEDAAEGHKTA